MKWRESALLMRQIRASTQKWISETLRSKAPAAMVLEDCRLMNVVGCTLLDCPGVGVLLKGVSESRVSQCLFSRAKLDGASAADWRPVRQLYCRSVQIGACASAVPRP